MTRAIRRSPRLLLAAALVALAALLVHDAPPVQAQATDTVLVSNIGQTAESNNGRNTNGVVQAQGFTTGSSAGGYTLSSIEAVTKVANMTVAQRNSIKAHLWSATTGATPEPHIRITELTVPAHPIAAGAVSFGAPANTVLDPDTSYFLVLFTAGAGNAGTFNLQVASTQSDDEDTTGQTGWSILDVFHNASGSHSPRGETTPWTRQDGSNAALQIRVNGREAPPPGAPTGLTVRAGDRNLDLTWTAPAGTLTGYDVHYTSSRSVDDDAAVGSDATMEWVDANHTGTAASHEVMFLSNGAAYRVRVRANNAAGGGAWAHGTGIPAAPTSSADLPDITLDVDVFYLTERDDHTIINVTATMASAAAQDTPVSLSLRSSPLLTPGVRGASSSDYYSDMADNHRSVTIRRGLTSASTTIAIDPAFDTRVEGDEAIVVTGTAPGLTVAPTDVIIEDGPYISFPRYIYGSLHYPGEQISVTVEKAIDQAERYGTVTYSLTRTEPTGNPLGLTFDPDTRQLTGFAPVDDGVPTTGLTTRYTITARDSAGHRATTIVSVAVVKEACLSTNTTLFPAATYPTPSEELVRDCNVLLAARDTLEGTTGNLNWATDTAITSWDGVHERFYDPTFWADQVVVRGMRLNGTIPPVLGHLSTPKLTNLVLGDDWQTASAEDQNKLTGNIPPELGIPANLTVLALGNNNLTGPIPRELAIPRVQPNFSRDPHLLHLYLHNNDLSGPIPPELGNLTLRGLNLFGNPRVTGFIPWQLAKNVPLPSGIQRVRGHVQHGFQILHLHENGLTGNIPWQLGRFGKIQSLALTGNQLTGRIPWQLGNLGKDEAGLERRIITGLYLNNNRLTGPIPPQLGNIANLQTLSLSENRLTGSIPWELGNLSPTKFQNLYLRDNQLSGEIPRQLGSLSALRQLHLHDNRLTGSVPFELGALSNLQSLSLHGNRLTSTVIPSEPVDPGSPPSPSAPPGAPASVAVADERYNSLLVTWDAPSGVVDYYELQYKGASRNDWRNVLGVSVEPERTIHLLTGGAAYDVRVRAVNASGAGPWSGSAQGTPIGDPTVPASILGLRVNAGDGRLTLNWDALNDAVTGYEVQYKQSDAQDEPAAGDDPFTGWVDAAYEGGSRSMRITGLTNSLPYDARVRARFSNGYGAWAEVQGTPQPSGPSPGSVTFGPLSVSPSPAREGSTVTLMATLDDPAPAGGIVVTFAIYGEGSSPVSADDYTLSPSSGIGGNVFQDRTPEIRIPAGQRTATATVSITADGIAEGDETLGVHLSVEFPDKSVGYQWPITVQDSDAQPSSPQQDDVVESDTCDTCGSEGDDGAVARGQDKYAELIARMYEWRNDPCCASDKAHTDRWDRALLAFGETVADTTLTPMTADEAQENADRGWERWVDVAAALRELERYADLIARMKEWRNDPRWSSDEAHTERWDRALLAFGETVADTTLTPMTADEAQENADRGSGWERWIEVAAALREIESG